ncbi:MAG: helix-turn-helix domain-containing protein [Actinomycetota bacterium]|nr:helix-turn-helix domain-containing protein [Actinomycetota bacterium]
MSIEEARRLAGGISDRTLRREIRDGRIRVTRVRGRVLIDPVDLVDWIERCKSLVTAEDDLANPLNDDDPAGTGSRVRTAAGGDGRRDES